MVTKILEITIRNVYKGKLEEQLYLIQCREKIQLCLDVSGSISLRVREVVVDIETTIPDKVAPQMGD